MIETCDQCKGWGTPGEHSKGYIIQCSKCKLNYWPNLGINCPAGSAVAVATTQALLGLTTPHAYDMMYSSQRSRKGLHEEGMA